MSKFAAKMIFRSGIFLFTIAYPDLGSITSLRTLFVKHLDHILVNLEQNCMVQTLENFDLFDKKWLTIFDILDNIFVTEKMFASTLSIQRL